MVVVRIPISIIYPRPDGEVTSVAVIDVTLLCVSPIFPILSLGARLSVKLIIGEGLHLRVILWERLVRSDIRPER